MQNGNLKNEGANALNHQIGNMNIKEENRMPNGSIHSGGPKMDMNQQIINQNPKGEMNNQQVPMETEKDNRPKYAKREETVSKLTPQQLAMPRISVYVTVPDKG